MFTNVKLFPQTEAMNECIIRAVMAGKMSNFASSKVGRKRQKQTAFT
jgi:hypothetical protein